MKPFKNSLLILSIVILNLIFVDFFILSKNKVQEEQLTIEEKVELLEVQLSAMHWREDTIGIIENSEQLISEIDELIEKPNTKHNRKIELYKLRGDVQHCIYMRRTDDLILKFNKNIYE